MAFTQAPGTVTCSVGKTACACKPRLSRNRERMVGWNKEIAQYSVWVHVCTCACVCICVCIYMFMCTCGCLYVYTSECMHMCVECVCIYMYVCVHLCVLLCVCACVRVCVCMHVCACIYVCTRTCIYCFSIQFSILVMNSSCNRLS